MFPLESLVKTWNLQSTMMMMYLHSWMVLKKDHREKHSLHRLLRNLQKKPMNQWNIK
ncbi:proteasome (prosome, macropain) subunit, alpha type 1, isoform CRA_e [Mus musculus]|nr:proteasome (prosome, macropain) subunit, alpha type 1, isoform CRA_e [Mus musculus]